MRWVGVMRWASGRVGRVILRMIPSRRVHAGLCKAFSTPQDLLRRAADSNAPRIPPEHAVVWRYHAAFVYLLNLCLLLH